MALALVQAYSGYPANSQASVVVSTGDLIIVGYSYNNTLQTITCTDNAAGGSNTYNEAGHVQSANGAASTGHIFYAIAKASETLTITCTAESGNCTAVHVVSGNNTTLASVLDGTPVTTQGAFNTTAFTSASLTTSNANDYLFCLWFEEADAATVTENGTGFTKQTEQSGAAQATFYKIVAATGTYQDSVTASLQTPYNSILAAFKAASGGGTAYNLTAATGTFSLTGETAVRDMAMPAAEGAFALTGHAATAGYGLGASKGAFGLTGNAATLNWSGAPVSKGARGAHWSLSPAIGLCA